MSGTVSLRTHSLRTQGGLLLGLSLGLLSVSLSAPSKAEAYADLATFDLSIDEGGSEGRYYSTSPTDRYGCDHCHSGGPAPDVQIEGFPESGYAPGTTYPVRFSWDLPRGGDGIVSAAIEIDSEINPGELVVLDPTECVGGPVEVVEELGRRVLRLPRCNTEIVDAEWTAPDTPEQVWLYGSVLMVEMQNLLPGEEGVTNVRRNLHPEGLVPDEGGRLVPACQLAPHLGARGRSVAGRLGGPLLLGLLMALILLLRRRKRERRIWLRAALLGAGLLSMGLLLVGSWSSYADDVVAGIFVRGDSDNTTVVTPHIRGRFSLFDDLTHVNLQYTADIWTSASIDVRTAATTAVSEQRDELNASISRDIDDITLSAGYRLSLENDYTSNGGNLGMRIDLADNNSTIDTLISAGYNQIGRSGDFTFQEELVTLTGRVSYTQVLDPETIVLASYEYRRNEGYQSSPYRAVYVGSSAPTASVCQGGDDLTSLCVPESTPNLRNRHAFVLQGRRALTSDLSLGLDYRFYIDDWGLYGNTATATFNALPDADSRLTVRYRFHQQSGVSFYRPYYTTDTILTYATRDRELSPMWGHRVALSYQHTVHPIESGPALKISAMAGGTLLLYDDFIGLSEVWAGDLSLNLAVDL